MRVSTRRCKFLSIQAQDFIEEPSITAQVGIIEKFLSIQVQDFIEEDGERSDNASPTEFLSIQAQDFIEESMPSPRSSAMR